MDAWAHWDLSGLSVCEAWLETEGESEPSHAEALPISLHTLHVDVVGFVCAARQ